MPESVAYFLRAFRCETKNWVTEGFSGDKTERNNSFLMFSRWAQGILNSIPTPRLLKAIYMNQRNITTFMTPRIDTNTR
jgi:hypothetical protein